CGVDLGILLLEGYKGNRQRRAGGQLPFFIGAARCCDGGGFVQGNSSLSSNYGSHHLMHRREYRCISTGRKRQGLRRSEEAFIMDKTESPPVGAHILFWR